MNSYSLQLRNELSEYANKYASTESSSILEYLKHSACRGGFVTLPCSYGIDRFRIWGNAQFRAVEADIIRKKT